MDLFRILLCFRDGKNLQFCFKSEANCRAAYDVLKSGTSAMLEIGSKRVEFTDDYGNTCEVDRTMLAAVCRTDVSKDLAANQDLQILQAHGQVKLNNRMAADPLLKAAMAMGGINGQARM